MKVEKRVSFGFRGEWGDVFKEYAFEVGATIGYHDHNYLKIDSKVQFKELSQNAIKMYTQPIGNLVTDSEMKVLATTDCYKAGDKYECVVGLGDIVFVLNKWWVVEKVDERSIYVPKKHSVYYVSLRNITGEIIRKEF